MSQTAHTQSIMTTASLVTVCFHHVVSAWKRARGSNQYRVRYESSCERCGERLVRHDRRTPEEKLE